MKDYLVVSPEVKKAIEENRPVVALESTIISHGMPYPKNVETALKVEEIVRENGAIPATIAISKGKLTVGITPEEIDYLGKKMILYNYNIIHYLCFYFVCLGGYNRTTLFPLDKVNSFI